MTNRIPEISDEKLAEFASRMRPLMDIRGKGLCYLPMPGNLRTSSYINVIAAFDEKVEGLVPFAEVEIQLKRPNDSWFAPSIADVLCWIPKEYEDLVVAFEVDRTPEQRAASLPVPLAENDGYHVATLRLYARQEAG